MAAALLLLASCADSPQNPNDVPGVRPAGQKFTVVVESVGELFTGGEGVVPQSARRHPISSVTPTQTFDRLAILIAEYRSPAKVVCKLTVDDWSNPDNRASIPWSSDAGMGRAAEIRLPDDVRLENGMEYVAYAIGYQTGTYDDYEPFAGIGVGDPLTRTEVASVAAGEVPEEIFAGAAIFLVENGVILSERVNNTAEDAAADREPARLFVRRQVAGTFGYFTHIPVQIDGAEVAAVRLVAARCNRTVIFGGFRGLDNSCDFHKDNVINGMDPRADFDALRAGSVHNDAFSVYEIDLGRWFPGNAGNSRLPFDANGNGFLDENDDNWQTDPERYPAGSLSLPRGTVFGDRFLVAFAATAGDVESGVPTFQLQLVAADGRILRSWDVSLRDTSAGEEVERTLVSLPDGPQGGIRITPLENIDTERCFSIVRNRLYTMGEKRHPQDYGENLPLDLGNAAELVFDVRHEWQIRNSVIFD